VSVRCSKKKFTQHFYCDKVYHPTSYRWEYRQNGVFFVASNKLDILCIVFILRDVESLFIKQTSDTLNLTEINVKTRLLREQLSAYYCERLIDQE
jgi:hypothetical protein